MAAGSSGRRRHRLGRRTDRRARRADPQRGRRLPRTRRGVEVDEWRVTMEVNVIGAVALTLALLPALHQARGHVVFINSGAGINASPGLASYTASKFALRGFADSLRNDEPSLRVTSIHPGRIATVMQEGLVAYEGRDYEPDSVSEPRNGRESRGRRGQRPARRPHPRGRRPPQRVNPARNRTLSVAQRAEFAGKCGRRAAASTRSSARSGRTRTKRVIIAASRPTGSEYGVCAPSPPWRSPSPRRRRAGPTRWTTLPAR